MIERIKCIEESYNELLREQEKWNYYRVSDINSGGFQAFSNKENKSIEKLLFKGGKIFNLADNSLGCISQERYTHILSVYLMGLQIYHKSAYIREGINRFLQSCELRQEEIDKQFMYIWLLLAFFHDIGYAIEENQIKVSFNQYSNPKNIDAMLPPIFTDTLFDNYDRYRKKCMNKVDHGIWGGRIMYKEVNKLRAERFRNSGGQCQRSASCSCNGLCCREELRDVYAKVARTIMAHNIYFANKDNMECYRCMGLDSLIMEPLIKKRKTYVISFKESPLLFLFDLVDTLEPVKRQELANALCLIRWRVNKKSITFDLSDLSPEQQELYSKQLMGMNSWLTRVIPNKNKPNVYRVSFGI